MMSVLDGRRDTSHGSASSPAEPTYADLVTSLSSTRRSNDDLPVFPRHQLQVLGLLGMYRCTVQATDRLDKCSLQ